MSGLAYADKSLYPEENALMRDAMSYVESFDVSLETAMHRLNSQEAISEFSKKLKALNHPQYNELYIEHKPDYSIQIMYTNEIEEGEANDFIEIYTEILQQPELAALAAHVKLREVDYKMSDLKTLRETVDKLIISTGIPYTSDINIKTGKAYFGFKDVSPFYQKLSEKGLSLPDSPRIIIVDNIELPTVGG